MNITHPAQLAFEDYRTRTNSSEKLDALFLALEILLRVDALLLAQDFLVREECRDDKIRSLLMSRRFLLGEWYALLEGLIAVIPANIHPKLREWFLATERSGGKRILQQLIGLRNPRVHSEDRTSSQFVKRTLQTASILFENCMKLHPELGGFQESQGGRLFHLVSGSALEAGPFLLPSSRVNQAGSVLIYRGCSANRLGYGSLSGAEYWAADTFQEVTERLRRKISPLEFVEATNSPDLLVARIADATMQTLRRLTELKIYRQDISCRREELETVLKAFLRDQQRVLLVDGPAGAGKTMWLSHIADSRISKCQAVLLITGDQLSDTPPPDCFKHLLRLKGETETAFERLGTSSEDELVLFLMDDLGATGREESTILSVVSWAEKLPRASPVKIILAIRSEQLRSFLQGHEAAMPEYLVRRIRMPPLDTFELIDLAEKLSIPQGENSKAVIEARRAVAKRMSDSSSSSVRHPGLATAILESANSVSVPSGFSAQVVYAALLQREALERGAGSIPHRPKRIKLLRGIASTLLKRGLLKIPIDDEDLEGLGLLDGSTGLRTPDYEALLSSPVVIETLEDYTCFVSFLDRRFFEYVASLNLPTELLEDAIAELTTKSTTFSSALSVAAHLVIRAQSKNGASFAWRAVNSVRVPFRDQLLFEIAALDGAAFLKLFEMLAKDQLSEAFEVTSLLVRDGESVLAVSASQTLIEHSEHNSEFENQARLLRARALFEIDDYQNADVELSNVFGSGHAQALALRADICICRRDYQQARSFYEDLLSNENLKALHGLAKGDAFHGLGYVFGRIKQTVEAERYLRIAIDEFRQCGESKHLAEAWGDLGQLLGEMGRFGEARSCLEQSLAIDERLGLMVGIGIVESHLGSLDLAEGKFEASEAHLKRALQVARRASNRWREAWVLEKMALVYEKTGRTNEAALVRQEVRKTFDGVDAPFN